MAGMYFKLCPALLQGRLELSDGDGTDVTTNLFTDGGGNGVPETTTLNSGLKTKNLHSCLGIWWAKIEALNRGSAYNRAPFQSGAQARWVTVVWTLDRTAPKVG